MMPCHAFTRNLLLLARGERIATPLQLARLAGADVILSDIVPPALAAVVRQRQAALAQAGLLPVMPEHLRRAEQARPEPATTTAATETDQPVGPEPAGPGAAMAPTEPLVAADQAVSPRAERAVAASARSATPYVLPPAPKVEPLPYEVEINAAREIRQAALHQMSELTEQARAGKLLDLAPVRHTVRHVVASLRRNSQALSSLVRLKNLDTTSYAHSVNVCVLTAIIAHQAGLSPEEAEEVTLGGLLHDIGKAGVPQSILQKPASLNEMEWAIVRQHPIMGLGIASRWDLPRATMDAIGQHHERLDGSGYPWSLAGDTVSPAGRMVAVADVYDAMTSERPYHPGTPACDAMRWIIARAGTEFDADVVQPLVAAIGIFPIGSLVRLSTGELAVVTTVNPQAVAQPTVFVVNDGLTGTGSTRLLDLSQHASGGGRDILRMEDPAGFGLDIERVLALAPRLAQSRYAQPFNRTA